MNEEVRRTEQQRKMVPPAHFVISELTPISITYDILTFILNRRSLWSNVVFLSRASFSRIGTTGFLSRPPLRS